MPPITCSQHDQPILKAGRQPWTARLKSLWLARVRAWHEASRQRAEWRALDRLDDRTLHDIGLAERHLLRDLPGAWRRPGNEH